MTQHKKIEDGIPTTLPLSIVVPVLNEALHIQSCLQPLQSWRHQGLLEVIIVDGGSEDGTMGMVQPLCDLSFTAGKGRARQMNAGAQRAQGQFLLFLHADTRMPENAVTHLLKQLETQALTWGRFDVNFGRSHPAYRLIAFMMNLRSRLTGIATGDQGIFVKTDVFLRNGGYADIPLMEDVELCRRLRRLSRPLCLSQALHPSVRKWEEHGILPTIVLMWRLRLRYALGGAPEKLHRLYYRN